MWLGEQITQRGIGNGSSLIIFAGIASGLPRAVASLLELGRQGQIGFPTMLGILVMAIAVVAFIVFMERAQRRIVVQYPKRQMSTGMARGDQNHMPLKLNMSGVIPPIFASYLLILPLSLLSFIGARGGSVTAFLQRYLQQGQPAHMILVRAC